LTITFVKGYFLLDVHNAIGIYLFSLFLSNIKQGQMPMSVANAK